MLQVNYSGDRGKKINTDLPQVYELEQFLNKQPATEENVYS